MFDNVCECVTIFWTMWQAWICLNVKRSDIIMRRPVSETKVLLSKTAWSGSFTI